MKKRLWAIFLSICLVVTLLPNVALAADNGDTTTAMRGNCGSNVTWELTRNDEGSSNPTYTLTISGSGEMPGFGSTGDQPWLGTGNVNRNKITAIVVDEGITSIGARSFRQLTSAKTLSLPASLQTISPLTALESLTSLENISVASGSTYFKSSDGVLFSADGSTLVKYPENKDGESYTVPSGTTKIEDMAFENLQKLKTITLNNGLTSIGDFAFSASNLIESVTIPDSVTSLGTYAFYNSTGLKSITVGSGITEINNQTFRNASSLETVTFTDADSITSIGERAFEKCSKLKSLSLSDNLTTIGKQAFQECQGLTSISDTNVTFTKLLSLGPNAFYKSGITTFPLDASTPLQEIPENAFYQSKLTEITIPDAVTTLGNNAFRMSDSAAAGTPSTLKKVNISDKSKLQTIGEYAFYDASFGYVRLPSTVTTISAHAFGINAAACVLDLTGITSVTTVANDAFNSLYPNSANIIYFGSSTISTAFTMPKSAFAYAITNGGTFETTPTDAPTLAVPTRAGYTFDGWYTSADFTESTKVSDSRISKGNSNVYPTYYAKWTLAAPTSVTVSADKTTIAKNTGSATLTATVAPELAADSGIEYQYQWYTGTPETGTAIDSATSQTYTAQNLTEATSYYCTVKAFCGEEVSAAVTSSAVTINVAENEGSVVINNSKTTATYGDDPFTFTYTASETATVASSNTSVATVQDNDGTVAVTIVGAGTTEISVGFDGDTNYTAASGKFTLTVNKATPTISISADKTSPIRGGGIVELTVNVNPADSTVTVTQSDNFGTASKALTLTDGKVSVTLDNKDAEYTFTASCAETTNYVANSVTCTVTVTRYTSGGGSSSGSSYSVSTPSKTENGTVTVSPKSASKGDTVTITVKPDSGYTLETLTVIDSKGNEIQLTDKGEGKYTFTMPAGKVEVKATFMDDNTMLNFFVDVKSGDYYYDAVLWAAKNGITSGTDAVHFSPEQPCTRAQIVTFLWRAAGAPEPKGTAASLTDVVSGSYYEKAVAWAIENGITTGTGDGEFSPDDTCTRAQAVTFLARALSAKAASAAEFSDVPTDSYFADAVAWAAANGVTEGIGGGLFGSDNDCTRGQIVTFLYRAYNK